MKPTIERIKELAAEFAEDSVVLDALKAKYPEAFEKRYLWRIAVNDSFCTEYYDIEGRGDAASFEVAKAVEKFLHGKIIKSTDHLRA